MKMHLRAAILATLAAAVLPTTASVPRPSARYAPPMP